MTDNHIPIVTARLLLDRFRKEDWRDFYRIELSLEQHLFTAESYQPSTEELTKNYVYQLSEQALHLEHMTLLWVRMVRVIDHSPNRVWAVLSR